MSDDAAEQKRRAELFPELLESLQAIIEDMDSDFGTDYDYNKARAAIAKALGNQEPDAPKVTNFEEESVRIVRSMIP